ncbi:MAG: hypothetical protein ING75_07580 [Rhodocyclaceae bacterium]|nr:hypothetical protein [Rhodocyclaceae bacterium]
MDKLLEWYCAEYERRTKAVDEGTADIDWLIPEYRVSWTEVVTKAEQLGIKFNPVDRRLDFAAELTKARAQLPADGTTRASPITPNPNN